MMAEIATRRATPPITAPTITPTRLPDDEEVDEDAIIGEELLVGDAEETGVDATSSASVVYTK